MLTLFTGRLLTASHVSALIEDFDQEAPCLIYIEMIPLLVEKIRIKRFPWDSRWKSFEAVQSRGVENVSKIAPNASWKRLVGEKVGGPLRGLSARRHMNALCPQSSSFRAIGVSDSFMPLDSITRKWAWKRFYISCCLVSGLLTCKNKNFGLSP